MAWHGQWDETAVSTTERVCHRCGYVATEAAEERCPHDQLWLVDPLQHRQHPHDPFLGRILGGRYPLQAKLGQGGMGAVYRSRQPLLRREVAVKVIAASPGARQGKLRASFLREARSVAKLKHPAIVGLHDFGAEPDGLLYMVLELVEGETMRQALQRGGLTLGRLVEAAVAVLDGLAEAHAAGVVHRDLKPENIMLAPAGDGGRFRVPARILDFGLAVMAEPNAQMRAAETLLGTPYYIAPEHATGQPIDGRADLFSLGTILYEALRGRPAFPGKNPVQVIAKRLVKSPTPLPVSRGPDQSLGAVVHRALQRRPGDRFADARAMQRALEAVSLGPFVDDVLPAPHHEQGDISTASDAPETDALLRALRDPDPGVRADAWRSATGEELSPLERGATPQSPPAVLAGADRAQPAPGSETSDPLWLAALVRADTGDDEADEAERISTLPVAEPADPSAGIDLPAQPQDAGQASDARGAGTPASDGAKGAVRDLRGRPTARPTSGAGTQAGAAARPPLTTRRSLGLYRRRTRKGILVAALVGVPLLLAAGALFGTWLGSRWPVPKNTQPAASVALADGSVRPRAPVVDAADDGGRASAAALGAGQASGGADEEGGPLVLPTLQGTHELRSQPTGATVHDEQGRLLGRTPLHLVVPAGGPEALYELRAAGHRPVKVRVPRDGHDHTSHPTLRPLRTRRPRPPEGRTGRLL